MWPKGLVFIVVCLSALLGSLEAQDEDSRHNSTAKIVYLAELTESATCDRRSPTSIQNVAHTLTAQYVIDQLNKNDTDEQLRHLVMPGVKYELKVEDICLSESRTGKAISDNLPAEVWEPGTPIKENISLPIGFVGLMTNKNARLAQTMLKGTDIPLISTGATAYNLTSGQENGNFFRASMSSLQELRSLFEFVKKQGWVYISVLYTEDAEHGQCPEIIDKLSKATGVCVAMVRGIDISKNDNEYYTRIADDVVSHEESNVVIYYGLEKQASFFVQAYLSPNRLRYQKILLVNSEVGKSEQLKSLMINHHQDDKPSPLQLVSASQMPGYDNVLQPITAFINRSLCDSYPQEHQLPWLNTNKRLCDRLTEINVDQLISTYHAVVGAVAAYNKTIPHSDVPSEFYGELRNALTTPSMSVSNVTFDPTGELITAETQAVLGFSVLQSNTTTTGGQTYREWKKLYSDYTVETVANLEREEVKSRCTATCDSCYKFESAYIYEPGDSGYVVIGTGTVSDISDFKQCSRDVTTAGILRSLAFDFGKEYFKNETGLDIGTLYIDTCSAELHTYRILDEIFGGDEATLIDTNGVSHSVPLNRFVLVIGDISSAVTIALQSYLRLLGIPQIAPGSTSNWLDDVDRYPHFLRITPSDTFQVRNILKVAQKVNIKSIGLIFTSSVYGNSGAQLIQQYAQHFNICIEHLLKIERSETSLEDIGRQLATDGSLPRAFVYFGDERVIPQLLSKIALHDRIWKSQGKMIIGGKTWGNSHEVIKGHDDQTFGSLTFGLATNFTYVSEGVDHFRSFLSKRNPNNTRNHLFRRFWQGHFNCHLPLMNGVASPKQCSEKCNLIRSSDECQCPHLETGDVFTKLVVMAWSGLTHAVKNALSDKNSIEVLFDPSTTARQSYFNWLKKVYIPSKHNSQSEDMQLFNETSNQGAANYDVYSIKKNSAGKADYVEVFSIRNDILHESTSEKPLFYHYGELDDSFGSPCTTGVCFCPGNIVEQDYGSERVVMPTSKAPMVWELDSRKQDTILSLAVLILVAVLTVIGYMVWSNRAIRSYIDQIRQESNRRQSDLSKNGSYLQVGDLRSIEEQPRQAEAEVKRGAHNNEVELRRPNNPPAERRNTEFENFPLPSDNSSQGHISFQQGDNGGGPAVLFSHAEQPTDAGARIANVAAVAGPSGLKQTQYATTNKDRPKTGHLDRVKEERIEVHADPSLSISNLLTTNNGCDSPADELPSQLAPNPHSGHFLYEIPNAMDELKDDGDTSEKTKKRTTYMHPETGEDNHSYEAL